eukprot:superscaffoldBa00003893_g17905
MEDACRAEKSRKKTPTLELSSATQLPESTNCLACSEDGRYLSLGHVGGLSVWCVSSLMCVAEWLQDNLEMTSVQMTSMAETAYLLGSVDDMGNGAVWLKVYHFPSEAWLKELEMAASQKQDPNLSGDVKWSPAAVATKIGPPKTPAGSPLSVVSVSATDSVFSRLQFVDYWPLSTDDSQTFATGKIHLMVVNKNGAIHTISMGRGTESCTMQLTERPKDSGDLPTITASVPFLQGLSLVVQRNGKMFLQDIINKATVCFLIPPASHLLATPCHPVYALNAKQQTLFIRGDQDPSCSASKGDCQSQLFIFQFGKSDIIKQFTVSLPDSPQQQKAFNFDTLEEACNLYLQQR